VIGITGMILSLIWCFESKDFHGLWLIALLSLLIFALGLQGIELNDKPHSENEQEIQEMISRNERKGSDDNNLDEMFV
jgi:hypothetical protein